MMVQRGGKIGGHRRGRLFNFLFIIRSILVLNSTSLEILRIVCVCVYFVSASAVKLVEIVLRLWEFYGHTPHQGSEFRFGLLALRILCLVRYHWTQMN